MITLGVTLFGALMVLGISIVPSLAERFTVAMTKRQARRPVPALPIHHSHRRTN